MCVCLRVCACACACACASVCVHLCVSVCVFMSYVTISPSGRNPTKKKVCASTKFPECVGVGAGLNGAGLSRALEDHAPL